MRIKGAGSEQVKQYQDALGGMGQVSFQGDKNSMFKDSRGFRAMFGNAYDRKMAPLSRPGKGIRHDYAKWRKLFWLAEERFLEMLSK